MSKATGCWNHGRPTADLRKNEKLHGRVGSAVLIGCSTDIVDQVMIMDTSGATKNYSPCNHGDYLLTKWIEQPSRPKQRLDINPSGKLLWVP